MLYHWEGPGSPFYDPTLSKMDRLNRGIKRELAQANRSLANTANTPVIDLKYIKHSYMMKLVLGTPPYEFFGYADTGSDSTWIQCQPCVHCYPQNDPIFDPTKSSTYRVISCISGQLDCSAVLDATCEKNVCTYMSSYDDSSSSHSTLSTDTLTIQSITGKLIKVDDFIFGCGINNKGHFDPESAGVIGLGRDPGSFITQLDKYINEKFSYCLSGNIETGKMNFGDNTIVQGSDVVTTRLFKKRKYKKHFLLATLEGLTIGTKRLNFNTKHRNIIIDSGAIMTYFPKHFYNEFKDLVTRQITAAPVPDSRYLCYEDVNDSFQFIPITAHFTGGADVVLNMYNIFFCKGPDVICLAVARDSDALWGSLAQLDFLVGFDLVAKTISFKPNSC